MSLFDEVSASMPTENVLAYSQARITQMKKRLYSPPPAPIKPEPEPEPEIIDLPKFIKVRPDINFQTEWRDSLRHSLETVHSTKYKLMADILFEVSENHGIDINQIKKIDGYASRKHVVVLARQEFFYRACNESVHSLPAIGLFLGGFDHTTVLHGRKTHEKRIQQKDE